MIVSVRVRSEIAPTRGITVGAFGDKFRKEREQRGFTLDDVSNVTKIGSRMLKAIEDERFDQLPGGIFNKGFIRAYARHLGLNEEEAVTEYLSVMRQAQVEAQNAWAAGQPVQARAAAGTRSTKSKIAGTARPPANPAGAEAEELPDLQLPRVEHVRSRPPFTGADHAAIPWRVPALVMLVILVGMLWWNRHSRGARAGAENPARATAATPAPSAPTSVADSPGAHPAETTTAAAGSSPVRRPVPRAPAAPVLQTSASDIADENDVTARNPKPLRSAGTTPEPEPALTLVIRAAENSWVSVTADGQQVTQETLIAPARTSVRASREIVVKTGNAAGISFLLNGAEIPAQGSEAEVKTFVFDADGIKPAPAGQTSDPAR